MMEKSKKKPFPNYCPKCGKPLVEIIKAAVGTYDPETGDEIYPEYIFWGCQHLKDKSISNFTTVALLHKFMRHHINGHPYFFIKREYIHVYRNGDT